MSRFRKVDAGTWSDAWFLALHDDAKLLWLYLLTGLEVTSVPGLLVAGRAQLAESMRWPTDKFLTNFGRLGDRARADWEFRVVWLPNARRHNTPSNPNVVTGWREPLRLVPECDLKVEACIALLSTCEWLGQPFAKAFEQVLGERFLARVRAAPSPAPVSSGLGVQGEGARPTSPVAPPVSDTPWFAKQSTSAVMIPEDATLPDDFRDLAATNFTILDVSASFEKFKAKKRGNRVVSWEWVGEWKSWLIDQQKFDRRERERRTAAGPTSVAPIPPPPVLSRKQIAEREGWERDRLTGDDAAEAGQRALAALGVNIEPKASGT